MNSFAREVWSTLLGQVGFLEWISELDPSKLLSYGIIGLGFLLAVLTFWLLRREQDREYPRRSILSAVYIFMAFSLLLCVAGIFDQIFPGSVPEEWIEHGEVQRDADKFLLLNKNLSSIYALAQGAGKRYIVESSTAIVRIERAGESDLRSLSWRQVYTIRPFRDISRGESLFREKYGRSNEHVFEHWFGTNEDDQDPSAVSTGTAYNLHFDAEAGDIMTLVTGIDTLFYLSRDTFQFLDVTVERDRSDVMSYSVNDYIGELTMIIESSTLGLVPVGKAAKRNSLEGIVISDHARVEPADSLGGGTISYRWERLRPGETVGIHFSWKQEGR